MDTQFDLSQLQIFQHTLTAATTFTTPAEIGRASLSLGAGSSTIVIKSTRLGTDPNNTAIKLINPGRASGLDVKYDRAGNTLTVFLGHDGSALISTAAQVAAAINNTDAAASSPGLFFRASTPTGAGAGVAAAGSGTLAGGLPLTQGPTTRLSSASGGGLFCFRQLGPIELVSVEFLLNASVAYTVSAITYDNLVEDTTETVPILTGTAQSGFIAPAGIVLPRGRALKFTAASYGMVRVGVRGVAKLLR